MNPLDRLDKINRPPAVENWTRMQHPDVTRTAKAVFSFVKSGPVWNYQVGRSCAKFYIEDGIDRKEALKIVARSGSAIGRPYNREFVEALFDYLESNPIQGVPAFDQMVEWFPLGPGIAVPIRPLAVVRHSGRFAPIFVVPWSAVPFSHYQTRLFMTVLEKSIFSLTDFEESPGQFIFLPKVQVEKDLWMRQPLVWGRGDFDLLSDVELNEQIRIFHEGKSVAAEMYRDYLAARGEH